MEVLISKSPFIHIKTSYMTIEQLKEGEIYITGAPTPGYIFLCKEESTSTHYIDKRGTYYSSYGHLSSIGNPHFKEYEPAKYEDAQWLKACIQAGRWVPKPKIKIEIY